jgi:polyphosphate kinase 2
MNKYSVRDLKLLSSKKALVYLLTQPDATISKTLRYVKYETTLKKLQIELIKLQKWVSDNDKKVIIIFEGRDSAGKGGAIRRATEHLNPRKIKVVALPKPTENERSRWYFQRYVNYFPSKGNIVFFDRSWYNRAVVEPVNGFCNEKDYLSFMDQVNDFEKMITDSNTYLIKFYFSISKEEQLKRFSEIKNSSLKKWKYSIVDSNAQELWDKYTLYKDQMFLKTNTVNAPWNIIEANRKINARTQAIKTILEKIPYSKDLDLESEEVIF